MIEFTDKGTYKVDEVSYYKYNLTKINNTLALSGNIGYEEIAKRMAYIDTAIIYSHTFI